MNEPPIIDIDPEVETFEKMPLAYAIASNDPDGGKYGIDLVYLTN